MESAPQKLDAHDYAPVGPQKPARAQLTSQVFKSSLAV